MEDDTTLHAGDVGAYNWGSLLVRFAPLAKVSPDGIVKTIAGAIAGTATWSNAAEFRGYIAILHEIVHYFQDAYTSIGHWDYFVKRKYLPDLLAYARLSSWTSESAPPYQLNTSQFVFRSPDPDNDHAVHQSSLQSMLDELIYDHFGDVSTHHAEHILGYLNLQTHHLLSPLQPGDESPYTIKRLLEAEAAASVWLQIRDLKMSHEQWEIAKDHSSLFNPGSMPDIYSETLEIIITVMDHLFGEDEEDASTWTNFKLRFSMLLTVVLVDLACAYPAPDQIRSSEMLKEYEPGIRFIRLLNAFQLLAGNDTLDKFVLAVNNSNFDLAEHYLLQMCEYPYPKASDIYRTWVSYYMNNEPSGDHVFNFRKNCITQRSNEYSQYVFKRPFGVIEKTQLYWTTLRGLEALGSSPEYLDPATNQEFVLDFMKQNRDWELVNFFFKSGIYRCPLATSQIICNSVTATCKAGIRSFADFPPKPGCFVRLGLENAEFNI